MVSNRTDVIRRMRHAYAANVSRIDFGTLRHEEGDKCPQCRQKDMWSVKWEGDGMEQDRNGVWIEPCGHYCASCGWGNGGSRLADEADIPEPPRDELDTRPLRAADAHDVASLPEDAATGDVE